MEQRGKELKINHYSSKNHSLALNVSVDSSTERLYYETYRYNSLPKSSSTSSLRICVISDTHDRHFVLKQLPKCDILIHAGDILMKSRKLSIEQAVNKLIHFNDWFGSQDATHKIVIGGNHDQLLQNLDESSVFNIFTKCTYLCNSSISVDIPGFSRPLIIAGLPVSLGDSTNEAFQTEEFVRDTQEYIQTIPPHSIDILITHGPCSEIGQHIAPNILHAFGHKHEEYGVYKRTKLAINRRKRSRSHNHTNSYENNFAMIYPEPSPNHKHKHNKKSARKEDNTVEITQRTRRYEARSRSRENFAPRAGSRFDHRLVHPISSSNSGSNAGYSRIFNHQHSHTEITSGSNSSGSSSNNYNNYNKHNAITKTKSDPHDITIINNKLINKDHYYVLAAPIMDEYYDAIQVPLMFDFYFDE